MDDPSRRSTDEKRRSRRARLWENLFQLAATSVAVAIGAFWAAGDERIVQPFGRGAALAFGGCCGLLAGLFASGLILKILQIRRREQ
jgi:hypothetical protein